MKIKLDINSIFQKALILLCALIVFQMLKVHNIALLRTQYKIYDNHLSILVAWPGGMYCDPVKEKNIKNVTAFLKTQPNSKIHFVTENKQIEKSKEIFQKLQKKFGNRIIFYDLDLNKEQVIHGIFVQPFILKEVYLNRLDQNGKRLYQDLKNPNSVLRSLNPASLSDFIRFISLFGLEFKNDDSQVFTYMDIGDSLKVNLNPVAISNLQTIISEIIKGDYQTCFSANHPNIFKLFNQEDDAYSHYNFFETDTIPSKQNSDVLLSFINQIGKEMYLKSELFFNKIISKHISDYGFYYDNKNYSNIEGNLEYLKFSQSSIFSTDNIKKMEIFLKNLSSIDDYDVFNYKKFTDSLVDVVTHSTGPFIGEHILNSYNNKSQYKLTYRMRSGIFYNESFWCGSVKYKYGLASIDTKFKVLIHFFFNYFSKKIDPKIEINGEIQKFDQNQSINQLNEIKNTLKVLFANLEIFKNQKTLTEKENQLITQIQDLEKNIEDRNWNISYKEIKDLYYQKIESFYL